MRIDEFKNFFNSLFLKIDLVLIKKFIIINGIVFFQGEIKPVQK